MLKMIRKIVFFDRFCTNLFSTCNSELADSAIIDATLLTSSFSKSLLAVKATNQSKLVSFKMKLVTYHFLDAVFVVFIQDLSSHLKDNFNILTCLG